MVDLQPYTVIWRPGDEVHFRFDWVNAEKPGLAVRAAAADPELVWFDLNTEPYDLIAIIPGHVLDVQA